MGADRGPGVNTLELTRVLDADAEQALIKSEVGPPDEDTIVVPCGTRLVEAGTGRPIATVAPYAGSWPLMAAAARTIQWSTLLRANGTRNRARTFGYTYRSVVLRREGCRACSVRGEQARVSRQLDTMASTLWAMLQEHEPGQAQELAALAAGIAPDWRMGTSPWSSGVANESSALMYHRDSANITGAWSGMLIVRDAGGTGGLLHLPAWGVHLRCEDQAAVFFDGRSNVHGVTPMTGRRISLVSYAIQQMIACGTPQEELARARAQRTDRETEWGKR